MRCSSAPGHSLQGCNQRANCPSSHLVLCQLLRGGVAVNLGAALARPHHQASAAGPRMEYTWLLNGPDAG